MSSWTWVAKTLKNLRLATPTSTSTTTMRKPVTADQLQSRLMSASAGVPKQKDGLAVPPRPKKPLTPYFRFLAQVREDAKKENPKLKITELMKKIGTQWDRLDEAGKEKYLAAYKKDMESYSATLDKYQASLTPEQTALVEQLKMEKMSKKDKREKKRRVKDLGKPKKPMTAFLLFLRAQAKHGDTIEQYQQLAKQMGTKWKGMSEAEKAPYLAQYNDAASIYEKDLKKWEDKMLKQGNNDVVRISHLTKAIRAKLNR
ncbi:transcription factor A, mitochondrial isoform X2 [Folsomia candida]|uniref:transcription factor A, mitochondrial isoform X2 n=1 Tax=Folsomia candida TaxID=158441 RepID=UPI000B8FF978|nr:transcription factor A, mitochondrial isoform X2 [Folsomia candida]